MNNPETLTTLVTRRNGKTDKAKTKNTENLNDEQHGLKPRG
jgi:hypothetical protein